VLPLETAREGIRDVLNILVEKGKGSFLTVLKKFGKANKNLLSFPIEGYTLTLDFKFEPGLLEILNRLDEIVIANGGRIYLAKDARMSAHTFKSSYPACSEFARIKQRVDPHNRFLSAQSRRLGISTFNAND
jgi:FAD/FMN-containing dehydrogenase